MKLLDRFRAWSLDLSARVELRRAHDEARARGVTARELIEQQHDQHLAELEQELERHLDERNRP